MGNCTSCGQSNSSFSPSTENCGCSTPGIPVAIGPQGEQGEDGLIGPAPEHQWVDTQLQFQNSDGSWGDLVDLKGDQGEQGEQGETGPVADVSEVITDLVADPTLLYQLRNALLPKGIIMACDVSPVAGDGYFDASGNGLLHTNGRDFRGWCLCDGAVHSGLAVPNLKDKFIIGLGTTYSTLDASVGSNTVTIGTANLPPHTHGLDLDTSEADPGDLLIVTSLPPPGAFVGIDTSVTAGTMPFNQLVDGNPLNHFHGIAGNTENGGFANTALDNKPASVVLVYIIKYL